MLKNKICKNGGLKKYKIKDKKDFLISKYSYGTQ